MENQKQSIELADIFNKYGTDFLKTHTLCNEQSKAFEAISSCRTPILGGHAHRCDNCGNTRYSYNSCRNRHCPKCQFTKQLQWIDKLKANLPPTKYYHLVFTIPRQLHKTFYINQRTAYALLFKAAAQALKNCATNVRFLGAQPGAVAVLHTWGQTLTYHPHIHMIVPAGGLSEDDMEWITAGEKFFLPVKALSGVFRGILCRLLQTAILDNKISLPEDIESFWKLKKELYLKPWNVYCKKPFGSPYRVVEYLGRYSHRVAITNHRIISDDNGKITFRYKDYKTGISNKRMTLEANDFIMRFLRHILPCGFYKIRYFGILALCNTRTKAALCFELIRNIAYLPILEGLPSIDVWRQCANIDPACCPVCKKGLMRPIALMLEKKNRTG